MNQIFKASTEQLVASINVSRHVAMYVTQKSLRSGGGVAVRDSFKINHETSLHMRMSKGYLEPLDIIKN